MNLVELDNFYGRKPTLELLKKRVLDLKDGFRQNLAFLGDRYVGKSTILYKFVSDLDDSAIIPVVVDLENKDPESFCLRYIGSILHQYSAIKGLPLHEDINLLMEGAFSHIPQTVKAIKRIQTLLADDKSAEAYREVLVLPQLFAVEANKYCLIVLDEFDLLEEFSIPEIYQELGKRIMTQKRCLYIVTSSMAVAAHKILSEKLSLLFGNFEVLHIEPFDFKTSEGFIRSRLGTLKISSALLNFLVDFTGGHPLYLKLLCQELLSLTAIHRQEEIYVPLLNQALVNILFNPWGVLSRHFEVLMNGICFGRGTQVFDEIVTTLANGKQKIKELVDALGLPQRVLAPKVTRLVELGVVVKNGTSYYLKDKVLRYWIKYVFQKRCNVFDLDLTQQKEAFQAEISAAVSNFLICSQKDLPTRIIELLHCFEDEAFQINNRRYKLPLFHKISSAKTAGDSFDGYDLITATADDGPWVIVLSRQKISEVDIGLIMAEAKKGDLKPQRCILISLADLDENTRVRALAERMWIWNEGELNALLNLYNKPFIVEV